jgi:hypothetical protein
MTELPPTGDAPRPRDPNPYPCNACGGVGQKLDLLDSRQGKNFRLFRCADCNKLRWSEEV